MTLTMKIQNTKRKHYPQFSRLYTGAFLSLHKIGKVRMCVAHILTSGTNFISYEDVLDSEKDLAPFSRFKADEIDECTQ